MALLPQEASAAGNRGWGAGRAAGVAASPVSLDDNSSAVPRLSPKPGAAAVAPQEVKFVPEPRSFAPPRSERGSFAPEGAFALNEYHRRDEYQVRAHLFFLLLFLPPWGGVCPAASLATRSQRVAGVQKTRGRPPASNKAMCVCALPRAAGCAAAA